MRLRRFDGHAGIAGGRNRRLRGRHSIGALAGKANAE